MYISKISPVSALQEHEPGINAGTSGRNLIWAVIESENGVRTAHVFGPSDLFKDVGVLSDAFRRTSFAPDYESFRIASSGKYLPDRQTKWQFDRPRSTSSEQRVTLMKAAGVVLNGSWWREISHLTFVLRLWKLADSAGMSRSMSDISLLRRAATREILRYGMSLGRVPVFIATRTYYDPALNVPGPGQVVEYDVHLGDLAPLAGRLVGT